jgi:rhodanese-related sulfurtransferase
VLAEARTRNRRYTAQEARADSELLLVDTRSLGERERFRVIPDSLAGRRVCLVCADGYSSSLAAALLVELGIDAGDLIGGYGAWTAEQ